MTHVTTATARILASYKVPHLGKAAAGIAAYCPQLVQRLQSGIAGVATVWYSWLLSAAGIAAYCPQFS